MVIDKIGNINNIPESNRSKSVSRSRETSRNDKVEISSEAKQAAETSHYTRMVRDTSDPERAQRVREIKDQIANGTYNFDDAHVVEMVADKIATYLLRR
ncbi:MAG: flagellar biosynthesis anti-sigma factor FlgM [Spirochaetes bacterium]|nr:flagellar biosynthesis anti-sigma factor FlgM [Spirochaetota bacterium]